MIQVRGELSVADAVKERNPSLSEVRDRLNQLKELAASFRETQGSIEEKQENPDAIASAHNVRKEFFGMFYRAKDVFEGYLDEFDVGSSVSQRTAVESSDWKEAFYLLIETQRKLLLDQARTTKTVENLAQLSNSAPLDGSQMPNSLPQLAVRLPAINIQPFSGERKQWMTFKDIYVSTIHNRADISDALKMQYLFSYLEGDAKRLVSKFAISGANYQNAWGILIAHFDKKRYTVFSLVHEFLAQSPVTQATPQPLGRLVTTSDEIIQQLDALGNDFTGRDPWLIHLILEKLDKETRASWSQEVVDTENPTFEDLLEFLKKRCEVLETCSAFSKKPVNELKKEAAKPVAEKLKMLHTTVDKKCAKCSSEHNTYQCEDFKNMSVKDRRELVQKAKLCFNCLRPSHSVKSCSSKTVCRNSECKQRHHTLLCPVAKKPDQVVAKKQEEDQSPEVPAKEEGVVVALTAGMEQGDKKSISLLPTAVVKVQQADGGFSSARVLIDSGSQASLPA
ncbi:hypothetical protein RP20_CCG008017 [Aedes albopictus]|nr:hypothetical protein RP20_CCG008017 [Aedes albopictus]